MKSLFISEWERLWSRKSVWLCFMAIPLILYASARYYLSKNLTMPVTSPEFTSIGNFPNAAMQEQLILAFNLIVVFISVLIITEEYRSGQLRMVMIRPVEFKNIFIAKFLVLITTITLYMIIYFLCSVALGFLLFPKVENVAIFYHKDTLSISQCLQYGVKYYFISLLTLIAIASTVFFISIISKSVVVAVGSSLGFILASAIHSSAIQLLLRLGIVKYPYIGFLSITSIQHEGIAIMLGQRPILQGFICLTLLGYFLIFNTLSYLIVSKNDKLI